MIEDFYIHRCTIYRLQGFTGYDFTDSQDGSVNESWGIVGLDVKSRFEPQDTPYSRRSDGMADVGTHTVFVQKGVSILNGDRIYWPNGEFGVEYFSAKRVKPIRDFHFKIHHQELTLEHIDWIPPTITTIWVPSGGVPNVVVHKISFDYRDFERVIADIRATYWLKSVSVQILVPFNDPLATLSVSDSTETLVPGSIMDLTINGNYDEITVSKQYSFNDSLTLSLFSGSSTQGAGVIFVQVLIS